MTRGLHEIARLGVTLGAKRETFLGLTGIGDLQFMGANQMILNDEFAGLCVMYSAIHGEEDKKGMPNPRDEEAFIENYDAMFNQE